jgi:hypothetical protein
VIFICSRAALTSSWCTGLGSLRRGGGGGGAGWAPRREGGDLGGAACAGSWLFAPLPQRLQHLGGALARGADDEDVAEALLVLPVALGQLLRRRSRATRMPVTPARPGAALAARRATPRTWNTRSSCPAASAAACSSLLCEPNAPNLRFRPSTSPIRGCAANASSHPGTSVCGAGGTRERGPAGVGPDGRGGGARPACSAHLIPPDAARCCDGVVRGRVGAAGGQEPCELGRGAARQRLVGRDVQRHGLFVREV